MTAPTPLLVDICEACELLSIGRTTLYRLIREGDVTVKKVGRRTLVVYASLQRFVDEVGSEEEGPGDAP